MERAVFLRDSLGLRPHPEGGHFRELHRSSHLVVPVDGRPSRSALTVIFFLLVESEISCLHRVASDESWHFHEGDPLELVVASTDLESVTVHRLGDMSSGGAPVAVVPAGTWQAARTTGAYSLVSCCVGPGFDFEDFEMLRDRPGDDAVSATRDPRLRHFV